VPNASVPKSRMWTHKSGSVRGAVCEDGLYSTPHVYVGVVRQRTDSSPRSGAIEILIFLILSPATRTPFTLIAIFTRLKPGATVLWPPTATP
jgi:hypothetical protein